MQFDGFFAKDGIGHIIEVKYSQRPYSVKMIQQSVDTILSRIGRYGWRNVKLILALVYAGNSIDLEKEKESLSVPFRDYPWSVEVRCYSLQQLAQQFGFSA